MAEPWGHGYSYHPLRERARRGAGGAGRGAARLSGGARELVAHALPIELGAEECRDRGALAAVREHRRMGRRLLPSLHPRCCGRGGAGAPPRGGGAPSGRHRGGLTPSRGGVWSPPFRSATRLFVSWRWTERSVPRATRARPPGSPSSGTASERARAPEGPRAPSAGATAARLLSRRRASPPREAAAARWRRARHPRRGRQQWWRQRARCSPPPRTARSRSEQGGGGRRRPSDQR